MRLFIVGFRFVYCGDVFTDGLRHAAADMGLEFEAADWNDADLPGKIERFSPDLVFVVHGRRFAQKYGKRFADYPTAVWLVDEPYEVDDTARWSGNFDTVFVNDRSTLHRHRNAHYLPMCYDPHVHFDLGRPRIHKTGFVGNWSQKRERYLSALAEAGLLGYVVGERWRNSSLARFCKDGNVPPIQAAEWYRKTEIVVNIFRDQHHYNAQRIAATAMNPRIYEALACGAAVVSDRRAGVPDSIPQFSSPDELVSMVSWPLGPRIRLDGDTYRHRLSTAIATMKQAAYA